MSEIPKNPTSKQELNTCPGDQKTEVVQSEASSKVSQRKIDANRRNAQRSTGPKTALGKEIVSRNATKHGFFSNEVVIKDRDGGESQVEFDGLRARLQEDLQPVGLLEELIVEQIAACMWRHRRIFRFENGVITARFSEHRIEINTRAERLAREKEYKKRDPLQQLVRDLGQIEYPPAGPLELEAQGERDARTDHLCLVPGKDLDLILRYETTIQRQLNQSLNELHKLQDLRRKRESATYEPVNLGERRPI